MTDDEKLQDVNHKLDGFLTRSEIRKWAESAVSEEGRGGALSYLYSQEPISSAGDWKQRLFNHVAHYFGT
jgi:hypothetical protein